MNPADFTVWLRGFLAACGDAPLTAAQLEAVRAELAKVVAAPAFGPIAIERVVERAPVLVPHQSPQPMPVSPSGDFEIWFGDDAKVIS